MRQDDSTVRKAMRPDLGASTPEPSLSEIVLAYYRTRFPETRAKELTNAYFKALESSPADGDTGADPSRAYLAKLIGDALARRDTDHAKVVMFTYRHMILAALAPTETGEQGKALGGAEG